MIEERSIRIRVWREIWEALKTIAGHRTEIPCFQIVDIASTFIITALSLDEEQILDILEKDFQLTKEERRAVAIRLRKARSELRRRGLLYA